MIRFRSAALSKSGRNVEFTAFFFFIAKEKGGKQVYKILIVDDEAIERRCISFILEKYPLYLSEKIYIHLITLKIEITRAF